MAKPISSNGYFDDSQTLEAATSFLRDLLTEFPFADWEPESMAGVRNSRSQAVQLVAMLSQAHPGLIPNGAMRLAHIYNSNTQRSGKSLLVKMAVVPANRRIALQAWSPKDEELRKVVDAEVLRGSRYIVFDNVRAHVSSQVLEAFMTSPMWAGRLLGKTQMFEMPNTAHIFITGNDLSVSPDIKHRSLEITLFVSEADVQARQVHHPIDDAWLTNPKNSKAMLNALWTMVRYWHAAGAPLATENVRIGYERFCQVFGGIVQFAGFGDPLAPPGDFDQEHDVDTETADARSLAKALAEPILTSDQRRREYVFQDVVNITHQNELFDWILDGKETEIFEGGILVRKDYVLKPDSKSKFGKLLKRYAPYAGEAQGPRYRLFRIPNGAEYRLIKMSSIGSAGRRKFVVELAEKQAE